VQLAYAEARFDLYCDECAQIRTFHRPETTNANEYNRLVRNAHDDRETMGRDPNYPTQARFFCTRDLEHSVDVFVVLHAGVELEKIGQRPSLADLSAQDINAYSPILTVSQLSELKKGVGLFAHGVGIGSIVYLRRTLEYLVADAEQQLLATGASLPYAPNERMQEKIRALQAYLPAFIVANRPMYGILSAGIHNLSEADCLAMFPPCLEGLKLGLQELADKHARQQRVTAAGKALQAEQSRIAEILRRTDPDNRASESSAESRTK